MPFRFVRDLPELKAVQHATLYYSEGEDQYMIGGERGGQPFQMTWDGEIFRRKYLGQYIDQGKTQEAKGGAA